MRRWQRGAVVVLASIVGVGTGSALFSQVGPFPFLPEATDGSTSSSTGKTPAGTQKPSTPRPGRSEPAFTELALLQPENFDEHNWKDTELIEDWDWLPDRQITSCSQMSPTDGQPVEAFSATYEGRVTTGSEIVVRYSQESVAKEAMEQLSDRIDTCASAPEDEPQLETETIGDPDSGDNVQVELWATTGTDDDAAGVVGIVRAGDRIAFLSLLSPRPGFSEVLDPQESTYIDALYVYAGRRLV